MTIASQTSKNVYVGNGFTTVTSYTFPILQDSDLRVSVFDPDTGAEDVLTLNVDYTVSGAGNEFGGNVTFAVAPADGATVLILRSLPYTQPTDYKNEGAFFPRAHERSFDRATMLVQQVKERVDSALTLPPQVFGVSTTLPTPEAGSVIGWASPDAESLVNIPAGSLASVAAFTDWQIVQIEGDGVTNLFGLPTFVSNPKAMFVDIDGVVQQFGTDYALDLFSGGIGFSATPASGAKIQIKYGLAVPDVPRDSGAYLYTPAEYGSIQSAIDAAHAAGGGTVKLPAGTIEASGLVMKSNVRLLGEGDATVLRAPAGLGNAAYMVINQNVGSYTDVNIALENLVIDGNGAGLGGTQARFAELVALVRVTGLVLRGVTVRNCGYIGMGLGSSRRILVDGCRFTECGFDGASSNGGPALWIASASTDYPEDVKVIGCEFYSNRWSGLHFSVARGSVKGCTFRLNKEAHIFGSRLLPNTQMTDVVIDGNTFDDVTKKDISAHAIEVGGHFLVISNNIIRNCDHGGIALTDCQNVVVEGNVITDVNRLGISAACLDIITTGTPGNQPNNITVSGNRMRSGGTTPLAAISIAGSGSAVTTTSIIGNNLNGTYSSGKAISIAAGKATSPVIRDNWGYALDPVCSEFQANAGTGPQAITGLGFRPRRVELHAVDASASIARTSTAVIPFTGVASCHTTYSDGTVSRATTAGNKAWNLRDSAGAAVADATFTSFDDDGFTVTLNTVTVRPFVRYVAYP